MITRSIVLTAILYTLSMASDQSDRINSQLTGGNAQLSAGGEVIKQKDTSGVYNYHEVVYEHIKQYQAKQATPQVATKVVIGEDITAKKAKALADKMALAAKEEQSQITNSKDLTPHFLEGFCYVKNDIEVERIATYAYLDCDFDNGKKGELVVSMVPDFYALALVAKPLYVITTDPKTGKKTRMPVTSGAVLTQDKTSINVANVVNDRKIARIAAAAGYTSLNVATKTMQSYMVDARAARQKQQMQITNGSGYSTETLTQNVDAPKRGEYLTMAGIEIVSEIAKVIGDNFVQNLPYTFKTYKGSNLYADLELGNGNGVRGFDPQVNSLIKKQPKFDITTGAEEQLPATDIPIRKGDQIISGQIQQTQQKIQLDKLQGQ